MYMREQHKLFNINGNRCAIINSPNKWTEWTAIKRRVSQSLEPVTVTSCDAALGSRKIVSLRQYCNFSLDTETNTLIFQDDNDDDDVVAGSKWCLFSNRNMPDKITIFILFYVILGKSDLLCVCMLWIWQHMSVKVHVC